MRRRTTIYNILTKECAKYNAEPLMGPAAVVIYVDGHMHVRGNTAIANFIRAHKDEIESQPDFVRPAMLELPAPPLMNKKFGFKKGKNFLNQWLPVCLGPRPGYGHEDERPS